MLRLVDPIIFYQYYKYMAFIFKKIMIGDFQFLLRFFWVIKYVYMLILYL
jgi:hypothetical protein